MFVTNISTISAVAMQIRAPIRRDGIIVVRDIGKPFKGRTESAEGAQYESQEQARSEAERVAPGTKIKTYVALKRA
jgi:hypothetical protein